MTEEEFLKVVLRILPREVILRQISVRDWLNGLPMKCRTEDPLEEALQGWSLDEPLRGMSAQDLLKGLPAEEIVSQLSAEERLKGLTSEDIARLSPEAREQLRQLLSR